MVRPPINVRFPIDIVPTENGFNEECKFSYNTTPSFNKFIDRLNDKLPIRRISLLSPDSSPHSWVCCRSSGIHISKISHEG